MKNKLLGCGKGEAAVGRQANVWGRISMGLPFHLLDADARSQEKKKSEWSVLNDLVMTCSFSLLSRSGLFMGKVTNHCIRLDQNASHTQEYEHTEAGFSKPIQRFLETGSSLMSSYPGNSYWVLLNQRRTNSFTNFAIPAGYLELSCDRSGPPRRG